MTQTVFLGDIANLKYGKMPSKDLIKSKGECPIFTGYRIAGYCDEYNCDEKLIVVARGVGGTGDVKISPKKSYLTNISIMVDLDDSVANKKYIYYQLTAGLRYLDTGSAQSQITTSDLKRLKINLPNIETQNKIADILGSLDEKIELNRQMNETLVQMGQALFKHYFIDNPDAIKWSTRTLGEFFEVKTGKKDASFGTNDGKYPFFTCSQNASKAPDYSFDGVAILLAGNGDFNLKYYRGKFEAYQRTYVLMPDNEKMLGYLFFLMSLFLGEITNGSRGSVIKFITKGMIESFKINAPDNETIIKLSESLNQITINIEKNNEEIQILTTLRDTLLPRLISGKLKI